jgi:integrase
MALTKRDIDRIAWDPAGKSQQITFDSDKLPGFGLRVYPTGRKSFVLWIRTRSGRKRLMTVGPYGAMTLDQARERARKMLVDVADGRDPAEDRRRVEREVRTFGELADRWLDDYAKPHRKSWREDQRRLKTHIKPRIGTVGVVDVRSADIRAIHTRIGKTAPVEANRVVTLIRAIYNTGKKWELIPADHPNPAAAVDRFKERSRERWLTAKELTRLVKALHAETDVYAVAAIKLLILTGNRKTELLRARWDRLDMDGRRLLLEDTKTGEAKVTPLSAPALEVLRGLPRMLHSPWIFPSPVDPTKPLQDLKRQWGRIRTAARVPDATIHDLRRTTGSWLVQQGVPLQVVGAALGHRDTRATEIYARIAATQPAEALEMLGEAFGGLLNTEGGRG